jgi:predicted amidophosphoribosyltransferase
VADRVLREKDTIFKMIKIYCKKHHSPDGGLCNDCRDLLEYADKCLCICPYGMRKPVCGRCPTNCFSSDMQARMAIVMRYAGPRMLYMHPVLTVSHLFDALNIKHKKGKDYNTEKR